MGQISCTDSKVPCEKWLVFATGLSAFSTIVAPVESQRPAEVLLCLAVSCSSLAIRRHGGIDHKDLTQLRSIPGPTATSPLISVPGTNGAQTFRWELLP